MNCKWKLNLLLYSDLYPHWLAVLKNPKNWPFCIKSVVLSSSTCFVYVYVPYIISDYIWANFIYKVLCNIALTCLG